MTTRPLGAAGFLDMVCECGLTRREHMTANPSAEEHSFTPAENWARRPEPTKKLAAVRGRNGVI